MSSLGTTVKRATNVVVLVFLALITVGFSVGSYRWAFKVNRMKPQAINPVMYPTFTYVNTSRFCCTNEPYYNLWRTYDWRTDAYANIRQAGVYTRVPVVYVHGNAGSYFCARSLARFLYEANVRQRRLSLRHFDDRVKRTMHELLKSDSSVAPLRVGDEIPESVKRAAEERVLQQHTPILATEMFSIDYLEESYVQSAVLVLKEARFLNHSMHLLMHNFLETYKEVLEAPAATSVFADAVSGSSAAAADVYPVRAIEDEYIASCCHHDSVPHENYVCRRAQAHLNRFSSLARLQAEVRRVQERGMWVWAESLGGAVSVVAALMNPTLYAGIVFVGSPTHYPPLFFDVGSAWLYKIISDAALRHYPQTRSLYDYPVDWETEVLPHRSPLELIKNMMALRSETLAARLSNTTLITVNGGALDDVVPSISGYLRRSTARRPDFYTEQNRQLLLKANTEHGFFRRDVSTETLRGVGQPMDHRGLVYGLQFLNHSVDSLVLAALLPQSETYFAPEEFLPSTLTDRLFPTIVETLPAKRYQQQVEETLFALTLKSAAKGVDETGAEVKHLSADGEDGEVVEGELGSRWRSVVYEKVIDPAEVVAHHFDEVCVDNGADEPIDLNTLLTEEEELAYLYETNSANPLHLVFGFTTYTPEEVHMPRVELYEDAARTVPIPVSQNGLSDDTAAEIHVRPATKLHLPFMRKDARRTIPGYILNTLVSFQVTRRVHEEQPDAEEPRPRLAYPRFCFHVKKGQSQQAMRRQKTFLRYDKIDTTRLYARAEPLHLGPYYIGNKLAVETHPGYALVTGLDSTTQETRMEVNTHPTSSVFPHVIAGTLRSLYLVARGSSNLAADDPEEQAQYFFGPFTHGSVQYNYSWKAFSTFNGDLNETYLIYVLGDSSHERPSLVLRDFEDTIEATQSHFLSAAKVRWWVNQWPERWLAFFSAYSGIGKLGGAYVLLFFTFFVVGGEAEKWFTHAVVKRAQLPWAPAKRLFYASPFLVTLVLTALVEFGTGTWAAYALKVCQERDPPPLLSNAQMTARMDWVEKLTLVLLLAMKPDYRDCQYSWLRMQSVPVWSSFLEHISNVYFGFVLTAIMVMMLLAYMAVVYVIGCIPHFLLQTKRLFVWRRVSKSCLFLWWALPTLSWGFIPNMPLCYRHFASVTMMLVMLPVLPWYSRTGYAFPLYMASIGGACVFPAHFDGAVLTIRNNVMLRRVPEAFWDHERNSDITYYQAIVWILVQGALGVIYMTMFFLLRYEVQLRHADRKKKEDDAKPNGEGNRREASRKPNKPADDEEEDMCYVLGDCGRRHPRLRAANRICGVIFRLLSIWITIIVMRRPLEGGVILVGNMTLLLSMLTKLIEHW